MKLRLTELAHEAVGAVLRAGDVAVDATAGNGHDTVFLAEAVGPGGLVIAVDIQSAAIHATRERLRSAGCEQQVRLIEVCHSTLADVLPRDARLRAAMFNLGYLPGSDKQSLTSQATTVPAVIACLEHLRPGGIVSVMAYRGHDGGKEEAEALSHVLAELDQSCFSVERHESSATGPVLWLVRQHVIETT